MWVMLGEMFPNQIRGSGLAVAGFFQWTSNFAITMTFPILLASVGLVITSYSIHYTKLYDVASSQQTSERKRASRYTFIFQIVSSRMISGTACSHSEKFILFLQFSTIRSTQYAVR